LKNEAQAAQIAERGETERDAHPPTSSRADNRYHETARPDAYPLALSAGQWLPGDHEPA